MNAKTTGLSFLTLAIAVGAFIAVCGFGPCNKQCPVCPACPGCPECAPPDFGC